MSTSAAATVCPHCGNALQPGMLRCRSCGQPVRASQAPANEKSVNSATTNQSAGSLNVADILSQAAVPQGGSQPVQNSPPQPTPAQAPPPPLQPTPQQPQPAAEVTGQSNTSSVSISDILSQAPGSSNPQLQQQPANHAASGQQPSNNNSARTQSASQRSSGRTRRPTNRRSSARQRRPGVSGKTSQNSSARLDRETPVPPGATDSTNIIWLQCECGRRMRAKKALAGKSVKCKQCGKAITIPKQEGVVEATEAESTKVTFQSLASAIDRKQAAGTSSAEAEAGNKKSKRKAAKVAGGFRKHAKILSNNDTDTPAKIEICRESIQAMGVVGNTKALELIIPYLQNESVRLRVAAANALAEIDDKSAVSSLVAALEDETPELRRTIVTALGKLKERAAIPALVTFGVVEPHLKFMSSEAVVKMGSDAVAELLDLLNDDDPAHVLEAVVLLGRLKDKRAIKALIHVLETQGTTFQAHAVEALGLIGDERTVGIICKCLEHSNAGVRVNAATALGKVPNEAAEPVLLTALQDTDEDVQRAAVFALGEIGLSSSAAPLCNLLNTDSDEMRVQVVEALGKIGDPRALDYLLELLNHESESIKLKAITALKQLKDQRAVEALIDVLYHKNSTIRQRAIDTLGSIGDAVAADRLETVLQTDPVEEVRVAAAKALGEIGDPASIDCLQEALYDEFSIRCRAIVALGQIGDDTAMPALLAMLKDPVPEARYHAATALAEIGHENAKAPLGNLLEDSNAMVRRGAAKALEKMGVEENELHSVTKAAAKRMRTRSIKKIFSWLMPTQLFSFLPDNPAVRYGVAGGVGLFVLLIALVFFTPSKPTAILLRGNPFSLDFSSDSNQLAIGFNSGLIEFWDTKTGRFQRETRGTAKRAGIVNVAFTADPKSIVYLSIGSVNLTGFADDTHTNLSPLEAPISQLVKTDNGKYAAIVGRDKVVVLWDLTTLTDKGAFQLDINPNLPIALDTNGQLLAGMTSRRKIGIWNTADGSQVKQSFAGYPSTEELADITIGPDGRLLAAVSVDGTLGIWEIGTGRQISKTNISAPVAIKFQSDSTRLLCFTNNQALWWDIEAESLVEAPAVAALQPYEYYAISADGKYFAAALDEESQVYVYSLESGALLHTLNR